MFEKVTIKRNLFLLFTLILIQQTNRIMNYNRIISMQKAYNVIGIQAMINSGDCWKLEGSVGRFAMDMLKSGICMLPKVRKVDYYGNTIPSRDDEAKAGGTNGTYKNCANFWQRVEDGDWDTIEYLEETLQLAKFTLILLEQNKQTK